MNILYTGDRGFIAGYVIKTLLDNGHRVVGLDNNWKYGKISRSFDKHPKYTHFDGDAKDSATILRLMDAANIDTFVMGAAIIGGISMFHSVPFFLLSENEKITAASFDASVQRANKLRKVISISSSMVYESATSFPSVEGDQLACPPPMSSYGFQKLSTEYFARAAYDEFKLNYMILRPFNCVGVGEYRAKVDKEIKSGNVTLAMSHVIPDLVQKILKGQDPLHILGSGKQVRHYTYGGDLADGFVKAIESDVINDDVNLSVGKGHTVLEVAEKIWNKLNHGKPFAYVSDEPFKYDVQYRCPDVTKAKNLLGFEAKTDLDGVLDEVITWCKDAISKGLI
jgi:nucleoside-diphosphate-sugar epimerase